MSIEWYGFWLSPDHLSSFSYILQKIEKHLSFSTRAEIARKYHKAAFWQVSVVRNQVKQTYWRFLRKTSQMLTIASLCAKSHLVLFCKSIKIAKYINSNNHNSGHTKWPKLQFLNYQNCQILSQVKSKCHKVKFLVFLTLSNVEFSPKTKIQGLQNDLDCRFWPNKIAKFDFTENLSVTKWKFGHF